MLDDIFDNDPDMIEKFKELFVIETQQGLVEMELAIAAQDWHNLAELAHKHKSSAKLLDAKRIAEHLQKIEEIATNQNKDMARSLLAEIKILLHC